MTAPGGADLRRCFWAAASVVASAWLSVLVLGLLAGALVPVDGDVTFWLIVPIQAAVAAGAFWVARRLFLRSDPGPLWVRVSSSRRRLEEWSMVHLALAGAGEGLVLGALWLALFDDLMLAAVVGSSLALLNSARRWPSRSTS